ncbi:MAG TPA: NAD-binding protein, partial [Burkholderiales bacterium]|nr:NAD-binding protein [Burkholderiales bacterium]
VRLFRYPLWTALQVAVGLTQIGEFSYVLVQVARGAGVVGDDVYNATLAASLLSILINAALVRFVPRWATTLRTRKKIAVESLDPAVDRLSGHVLICGYTEVGAMAARAFESFGIPFGVVDLDPEHIRDLRARGIPCLFGDATHTLILEHAHAATASAILVTMLQPTRAEAVIRHTRKLNPRAAILARAHRQRDYQFFLEAGASVVVQPEMEAAATMVRDALSLLKQPEQKTAAFVAALRVEHPRSGV